MLKLFMKEINNINATFVIKNSQKMGALPNTQKVFIQTLDLMLVACVEKLKNATEI